MNQFDCIIVGGGPAGSTALRELAREGAKVCLFEKNTLPRYKVCGGAVSNRAALYIPFDWSKAMRSPLNRIKFLFNSSDPLNIYREDPCAHFVMRDEFDQLLLEKGIEAGGI